MRVKTDTRRDLYQSREDVPWVLVKRDAPIPAWKVNYPAGEMERIGTVLEASDKNEERKEVFIGVGHCPGGNPWPSLPTPQPGHPTACADPLVIDVLFVVEKEGAKPPLPSWALPPWAGGTAEEGREGYWWEFNVYFNGSLLPANPQNGDLPCWMSMECDVDLLRNDVSGECRDWLAISNCGKNPTYPKPANCEIAKLPPSLAKAIRENKVLGADFPAPAFVRRDNLNSCSPTSVCQGLADFYVSFGLANSHQNFKIATYTYFSGTGSLPRTFNVYYDERTDVLYLDSGNPPFYSYIPISKIVKPAGKTLQLGTFFPFRKFSYEWWTPACKPAIYLYPEKPMEVSVKVSPNGFITQSIPEHGKDGWRVTAYPGGRIEYNNATTLPVGRQVPQVNKKEYPYLYYEAQVKNVNIPKEGFVVKKEELKGFFEELLPRLGLNQIETEGFKSYWLSVLTESPYYFVGILPKEEIDRAEQVKLSPSPDVFIRVRLFFEPLEKEAQVSRPKIDNPPERLGFTAVDWGGLLTNGSCGGSEKIK